MVCFHLLQGAERRYKANSTGIFGVPTPYVFDVSVYNIVSSMVVHRGTCRHSAGKLTRCFLLILERVALELEHAHVAVRVLEPFGEIIGEAVLLSAGVVYFGSDG